MGYVKETDYFSPFYAFERGESELLRRWEQHFENLDVETIVQHKPRGRARLWVNVKDHLKALRPNGNFKRDEITVYAIQPWVSEVELRPRRRRVVNA